MPPLPLVIVLRLLIFNAADGDVIVIAWYADYNMNSGLNFSFQKGEPVVVLGATNTGEVLDPALTRPGRFDMQVQVLLPDIKGRKDMLNMYINKLGCGLSKFIIHHLRLQNIAACFAPFCLRNPGINLN